MRSIKMEGAAGAERQRIGVVFAAHVLGETRGELVESVEVAGELGHAADEAAQILRPAECRVELATMVDEGQAHHLAGALPDQHLHPIFGGGDVAFDPGAVFGIVLEGGDVDRVHHPAHHHLQPAAHELARPCDLVERKQEAQQQEEQPIHGLEYMAGSGAVGSGEGCPPVCALRSLRSLGGGFLRPPNPDGAILHFSSNHRVPRAGGGPVGRFARFVL